jgi:hypothetical protein
LQVLEIGSHWMSTKVRRRLIDRIREGLPIIPAPQGALT